MQKEMSFKLKNSQNVIPGLKSPVTPKNIPKEKSEEFQSSISAYSKNTKSDVKIIDFTNSDLKQSGLKRALSIRESNRKNQSLNLSSSNPPVG